MADPQSERHFRISPHSNSPSMIFRNAFSFSLLKRRGLHLIGGLFPVLILCFHLEKCPRSNSFFAKTLLYLSNTLTNFWVCSKVRESSLILYPFSFSCSSGGKVERSARGREGSFPNLAHDSLSYFPGSQYSSQLSNFILLGVYSMLYIVHELNLRLRALPFLINNLGFFLILEYFTAWGFLGIGIAGLVLKKYYLSEACAVGK